MPSHFGWVDFAEHERHPRLDPIHQLRAPGARDELGLGTIRDAFANHFFPGWSLSTSTPRNRKCSGPVLRRKKWNKKIRRTKE